MVDTELATVRYFAYGSNMQTSWLRARVPSARPVGRARLPGWRLVCNKRSQDGSAKANLVQSPKDTVWGVLYAMNPSELPDLDRVEGGYQQQTVQVIDDAERQILVQIYVSAKLTSTEIVFDWYRDTIVAGARDHGLPSDYVAFLEQIPAMPGVTRMES